MLFLSASCCYKAILLASKTLRHEVPDLSFPFMYFSIKKKKKELFLLDEMEGWGTFRRSMKQRSKVRAGWLG